MCRAMLRKNLHDIFSNERIKLALERQLAEHTSRQILGVDAMEMFSPRQSESSAWSTGSTGKWPVLGGNQDGQAQTNDQIDAVYDALSITGAEQVHV